MPTRKPVRHLNDEGWQVLHDPPHTWVDCQSREDAELIAEAESLCKDVFDGRASGEEVANRLDAMALAVTKNIGGGMLLRYVQHAEKGVRGVTS